MVKALVFGAGIKRSNRFFPVEDICFNVLYESSLVIQGRFFFSGAVLDEHALGQRSNICDRCMIT